MNTKLSLLLGAALMLPACGGKKEEAPTPAPEPTPAAADAKKPGEKEPIPPPPDVAAPPADAEKTASGLAFKILQAGTGTEKPGENDTVKVHYTGWTTDGKSFDSSVQRGRPSTFPVNRVIKGWTEGLQLMVTGEKRRLWIPEELAYKGRPGKPQGMLVFDVELIEIKKAPPPPPVPEDVAAVPKDAKKTKSGLAYRVLTPGTGKEHPTEKSLVQVDYTGWTTAGEMFDSSITRGRPAIFPLTRVVKGWTEGVQLMVEGEKTRFWVPEEMAYKDVPGKPQGMLVFDIELKKILPMPAQGEGKPMTMKPGASVTIDGTKAQGSVRMEGETKPPPPAVEKQPPKPAPSGN